MTRGSIALTPFPFTDLSGRKVRPALVVSRTARPGSDVILAFMTTFIGGPLQPTDLLVESSHPDFALTGLKGDSVVKLDKLITIERSIVLGELGALPTTLMSQAAVKLRHALDL